MLKNSMEYIQLLSLFYKWDDWGTERFSDLFKDTQLVHDGASLQIQEVWPQSPHMWTSSLDTAVSVPTGTQHPSGNQIRHKPPGALSERTCAGPACDLTLVGPPDNGATGEHQALGQRQCASANTSHQNNKHRWLPQHRSLNIEVRHPCLTACGDTSVERSQWSLLSPLPRGKIWGCVSSPARLLPPRSSPPG